MKYFLTASLLFILFNCSSLNDTTFLDKDWNPCKRVAAVYYRLTRLEGANFIVTDYYLNNKPQMIAVCSRIDSVVRNGKCTFYNEQGLVTDEGIYEQDIKVGIWTFNMYTKEGGKLSSGFFKNNLVDSVLTSYYPSGSIYSTGTYKNDTLNGPRVGYREDGTVLSTSEYMNGKLHGWYVEYGIKGRKKYEEEYRNGKTTGNRKLYFENGQVQGDFLWTKRRVDGYKIWYYENGDIQSKVIFVNGKRKKIVRSGKYVE